MRHHRFAWRHGMSQQRQRIGWHIKRRFDPHFFAGIANVARRRISIRARQSAIGFSLAPSSGRQADQKPCPNCGGTGRMVKIIGHA